MEKFSKYVEKHTRDAVFMLDVWNERTIMLTYANAWAEAFLQKPVCHAIGEPVQSAFDDSLSQDIQAACRRCLEKGGAARQEMALQKAGGKTAYWDASISAIPREGHTEIVFWCRDVTASTLASRQMEKKLSAYDAFFSSVSYGLGLFEIRKKGTPFLKRANQAFHTLADKVMPDWTSRLEELRTLEIPYANRLHVEIEGKKAYFQVNMVYIQEEAELGATVLITIVPLMDATEFYRRGEALLTGRENEILALVCKGKTNKSIALSLGIAEGTVKKILYNAYRKLHVQSRAQAVKYLLFER